MLARAVAVERPRSAGSDPAGYHTGIANGARAVNDLLAWGLARARQQTLSLVVDLPADRMCLQAVPGEHHAAWIVGHLLLGDSYLLSLLGVRDLPEDFQTLLARYGPGATPSSAPDLYDPKDSLVGRLTATGSLRDGAVTRMTAADLERHTPDPVLAKSQPTIGHHLQGLAVHEGYHAGQLSAWRRAHGFASARWVIASGE